MQESALAAVEARVRAVGRARRPTDASLVLFDDSWHQGVVGIVASRLKDRFHRPTIAFAPNADGSLRGSGRSIAGLHLRDALDLVYKREPGLIAKFGGHAMAAGLSIARADLPRFEAVVRARGARDARPGAADPHDRDRRVARRGRGHDRRTCSRSMRRCGGRASRAPVFADEFAIESQRIVKEKHLKLTLRRGRRVFDAIWFNSVAVLPDRAHIVYRLASNSYNGSTKVQFIVEQAE